MNIATQFDLYRDVTLAITSSLDIGQALGRTFEAFSKYLPLSAISFHEYRADLEAAKVYYLVTPEGFREVDMVVPLKREAVLDMIDVRKPYGQRIFPCNHDEPTGPAISKAISKYAPDIPRAHMCNILSIGDNILTHMSLLGTHPDCYTKEHCAMVAPLLPPMSLAISNLMQFKMNEEFRIKLGLKNTSLKAELEVLSDNPLVGANQGLAAVFNSIRQLSSRETPVLITGETGTGKDVIANLIQCMSPRREGPFVKVNCGALPETLMDSELFGVEKGAYTGASSSRPGRFEQADGGTIFLDEIGELTPQAQVRLLRVLQNREVERLGGTKSRPVDIRIIAATNSNLESMLQNGTFREDLYYRLNVFRIHVPPLRERREDLVQLIMHFAKKVAKRFNIDTPKLDLATLDQLMAYSWPGNVRELENLVERAMVLSPHSPINLSPLLPEDPSWYLNSDQGMSSLEKLIDKRIAAILGNGKLLQNTQVLRADTGFEKSGQLKRAEMNGASSLNEVMVAAIQDALSKCQGKINGPGGAAEALDINPSTLRQRMRKFGISANKFK